MKKSRRAFLAGVGTVSTVLLAGCGGKFANLDGDERAQGAVSGENGCVSGGSGGSSCSSCKTSIIDAGSTTIEETIADVEGESVRLYVSLNRTAVNEQRARKVTVFDSNETVVNRRSLDPDSLSTPNEESYALTIPFENRSASGKYRVISKNTTGKETDHVVMKIQCS